MEEMIVAQELKVGDRVRQIGDSFWRGMEGVYDGRRTDGPDDITLWDYFIPDAGSKYFDGTSAEYHAGKSCGMKVGSFELINPPIPADIAERAMALVEKIAASQLSGTLHEARAILDALKPVSVDVLAARAVCGETLGEVADFANGDCDGGEIMRCAVAAIAKGRQMQKDGE